MGALLVLVGCSLVAVVYFVYRVALPKPLAGIPYNHDAVSKLFGDVPEMMSYVLRTKRIFCWLTSLIAQHRSPIVQAFIKPMSLPWVVVTDPFESQDILLRRTKEFDRSGFFGELIGGILPEQHIQFLSTDARIKDGRNLINHLMAPSFISQVSAPEVYKSVCSLMELWQVKCDRARGRPFAAHDDITYWALDSIFASSFGVDEAGSNTSSRLDAVKRGPTTHVPQHRDEPVAFPTAAGNSPPVFQAVLTLANSVTDTQLSPAPRLTSWVLRQLPYMRNATAVKDQWLRARTDEVVALVEAGDGDGEQQQPARNALHSVLLRERHVACKAGRKPDYTKRAIADEFFGFMTAGYDTTATTVAWGVKLLADHASAQQRLRRELRAAFTQAALDERAPTYQELAKAHIPYLDAVVEEVLRHANTIAFVVRTAQRDTTVLGRHIPKGTDVFFMANGAGYLEPHLPADDAMRSPGARRQTCSNTKALTDAWDDQDIAPFKPERWLRVDPVTGQETFDPMAGPTLAFGLGPRGCFGRRLALQSLRIQFAMTIWHFHLLEAPPGLSGYDAVQRFAREPIKCYMRLETAVV
ncbi:cytochrome P450 [Lophiostoma macrostomum CBS 122681]|uniref:Cytochrome P450 n=1 Tax=Lophiostoma macrostomum CBS 122681 TaxID=1314788 RepID=A0A6A6SNR4_9PLEO|nr:cytochrome P450 [Lophiostoma macrostomum CBS 122681]